MAKLRLYEDYGTIPLAVLASRLRRPSKACPSLRVTVAHFSAAHYGMTTPYLQAHTIPSFGVLSLMGI